MSWGPAWWMLATSVAFLTSAHALAAQSRPGGADAAQRLRIVVPDVTSSRVVTDGIFSVEEWAGAFRYPISDKFELYLLADSANLYIALKFLEEVEADFVSEVYLAVNDREFVDLHSSGALGEGVNSFSPDLRRAAFTVGRSEGWESNVSKTGARLQAKEYRIARGKLPGGMVRVAGGLMVVNRTIRESATFPERFDFGSPSGWVELVLAR